MALRKLQGNHGFDVRQNDHTAEFLSDDKDEDMDIYCPSRIDQDEVEAFG